jgi:hypothetical protein
MADTFTGSKYPQSIVEEIFADVYAEARTLRDGIININDNHKSNTEITETTTTVTQQAYSVDGTNLDGSGSANSVFSTTVNLNKFQYDGKVLYNQLNGTRFEKSIAAGAASYISDEYDRKVVANRIPAIGVSIDQAIWNGATAAQKALVAGLTAGAAQGSLTAYGQDLVAAMPVNQFSSIVATLIHNASQGKATPGAGIGDYRKVLAPETLTSANIAAEYLKLYETHFAAVPDSSEVLHKIYAPLGDKALMVSANKGATTVNPDFVQVNDSWTYNGYEVIFVPMIGFRIFCNPEFLLFLTDKTNDGQSFEQQRGANLADFQIWKSIMFAETFPVNQRYITVYGG